ncbi:type III pantothenate kinase [Clostridia bacterium]|nr:type III pantothenate kinase [Clostridia bacterium]
MLLTADVGNTNIKLGIFNGENCEKLFRLGSGQKRTADEMGFLIAGLLEQAGFAKASVDCAIISSVVPDITAVLASAISSAFSVTPLTVSPRMKMDVTVKKVRPAEVGADRLVNCVAAKNDFPNGAVIIADYGTAIKYDVLSADGEFLTGITAPGIELCAEALFSRAALIGQIELTLPPTVVAVNTVESVQAGILYGKIGEAEYIINRLKKELALNAVTVIATGGAASLIASGTDVFDVIDPFLTLKGLRILYDTNR